MAFYHSNDTCSEVNERASFWSSLHTNKNDERLFCPMPRRPVMLSCTSAEAVKPVRQHSHSGSKADVDSECNHELLEIFLLKNSLTDCTTSECPHFSGPPPCRVRNPLIKDAKFSSQVIMSNPRSPLLKKTNGVITRYRSGPHVRVEGFDCTNRDVPAFA